MKNLELQTVSYNSIIYLRLNVHDMYFCLEKPKELIHEQQVAAIATPPKVILGGYNYNFVVNPVPSHLVCIICKLPCKDARYSGCCGMTCCSSCLEDAINLKKPCPYCPKNKICGSEVKFEYRDQEINSLHIYCINKGKGCGWQGRLDSINDHLAFDKGCQFHEFLCPFDCEKIIQRQHMTTHVKNECPNYEIACQFCHINEKRHIINGEHKDICPKFPLPCPNSCEIGTVFREDMANHRAQCPLELIQCMYHDVGCTATMIRKNLEQHCNNNFIEHLKLELAYTKTELGDAVNKITDLETIIHRTNCALRIALTSSVLAWPDKLVAMETICESNVALPCPVILKMTGFNRKKQEEVEWFSASFFSHNQGYKMCLNVDANGYGDNRGTHASVWLCLLKGPHDDTLPWPLRETFEIQMLNQIRDNQHHALVVIYHDQLPDDCAGRITGNNNKANVVGEPSFISHEDLYNNKPKCQFVKDDCVYFKIAKQ